MLLQPVYEPPRREDFDVIDLGLQQVAVPETSTSAPDARASLTR